MKISTLSMTTGDFRNESISILFPLFDNYKIDGYGFYLCYTFLYHTAGISFSLEFILAFEERESLNSIDWRGRLETISTKIDR